MVEAGASRGPSRRPEIPHDGVGEVECQFGGDLRWVFAIHGGRDGTRKVVEASFCARTDTNQQPHLVPDCERWLVPSASSLASFCPVTRLILSVFPAKTRLPTRGWNSIPRRSKTILGN